MKVIRDYTFLVLIFCKFFSCPLQAQEIAVRFEWINAPVALNDPFTLTVIIEGSEQREVNGFPNIPGFVKRGTNVTSSTLIVGGKSTLVHRISQNYLPTRVGTFRAESFTMTVNGAPLRSDGLTIEVVALGIPRVQDETSDSSSEPEGTFEFGEVPTADAFLSLRARPTGVFVGEGFTVRLSLVVAEDNPAELNFYQLDAQLAELFKQLRPANCWEENFGIRGEPQEFKVRINGKAFLEYRIFEAVYFPLTAQPVVFPSLELRLLEGTGAEQKFRSFRSAPVTVRPRPLPPHPLRDRVTVGTFQLRENLSTRQGRTGRSVIYTVRVVGNGHLASVQLTNPEADAQFDFYPPEISQSIDHRNGRVSGEKVFRFQIIPKRAGSFPLRPYFRWTYFDPRKERYQTLTSRLTLRVSGQTLIDGTLSDGDVASLYDGLDRLDTTGSYTDYQVLLKGVANALLTIMLLGILVLFWQAKPR